MSNYLKISIGCVLCALCAAALRRQNADFSTLLAIAGCCLGGIFLLELFSPVLSFVEELFSKTGMERQMLSPLLKTAGVGMITQVSSSICQDAGESALAKIVEIGGTVLCVCLSLPLLTAVLSLIQNVAGD